MKKRLDTFSFQNKSELIFSRNMIIEDVIKAISLSEQGCQEREELIAKTDELLVKARETNHEVDASNALSIHEIDIISKDRENIAVTTIILKQTLDGKFEKLKQGLQIFADVFVNFNVEEHASLIIPLSKSLFHGKYFFRGPIMELTHKTNMEAFFKNIFTPTQIRKLVAPTFRHENQEKRAAAIKQSIISAMHKNKRPVRLIEAVKDNDLTKVKFYVSIKTDLNLSDHTGNTALHWAFNNNTNIQIASLLIQNGADMTLKNNKRKIPIDLSSDPQIKEIVKQKMNESKDDKRSSGKTM